MAGKFEKKKKEEEIVKDEPLTAIPHGVLFFHDSSVRAFLGDSKMFTTCFFLFF